MKSSLCFLADPLFEVWCICGFGRYAESSLPSSMCKNFHLPLSSIVLFSEYGDINFVIFFNFGEFCLRHVDKICDFWATVLLYIFLFSLFKDNLGFQTTSISALSPKIDQYLREYIFKSRIVTILNFLRRKPWPYSGKT